MKRALALIFLLILALIPCTAQRGPSTSIVEPDHQSEIATRLDLGHPDVMRTAVTIARDYPGEFSFNQVNAIYRYLVEEKRWSYFNDPSSKDYYKYANETLEDGYRAGTGAVGDCDDFAILMASLIETLGGSSRIIFAQDEESGQGHAYAELYIGKKDNPLVKEINEFIMEDWGESSVPGLTLSGDGTQWLNLDYNATFPGGVVFGGGKATTKVAWISGNRTAPKVVPLIDSMDSLGSWEIIKDDIGSNVSIRNVASRKGKAIEISYDLKEDGFAGIARDVDPKVMADLEGINFTYLTTSGPAVLELVLIDENNTSYSTSWNLRVTEKGGQPTWIYLDGLYDDFESTHNDAYSPKERLNRSNIQKLKFVIHDSGKNGEIPNQGNITLDQIRGAMRVPTGSIWALVEDEQRSNLARQLAAESERIREQEDSDLQLSVLLATEAMRMHPCIEADQALRHGLEVLPKRLMKVTHNDGILKVLFSPDGTKIATAGRDGTARIWDINNSRELANITHKSWVIAIAFSPNGSKLATASVGNYSVLWDIVKGKEIMKLEHRGIRDVAFSSDGTKLATACSDRILRIWDANTGRLLNESNSSYGSKVVFSPNRSILADVSKFGSDVTLWDADTYRQLNFIDHNSTISDIAFSLDGSKMAIAEYKTVWIHDAKTGAVLAKLNHEDHVETIAFSPDGSSLATVCGNIIRVWSLPCGIAILKLAHKDRVTDIEFSSDGTKLATCGWDETAGIARVWDASTGKELARMAHDNGISSIAFSPKGDKLATASRDNTSAVWDLGSNIDIIKLSHHNSEIDYPDQDQISKVVFSPDGTKIATASWDETARLWNATTGKEIMRIEINKTWGWDYFMDPRIDSISFNIDGTQLAIGYKGAIRIVDVNTTETIFLIRDVGEVNSIVFSPDRTMMAANTWGGKARIWNLSTGEMLIEVPFQNLPEDRCYYECYNSYDVAFSPDDKFLALGTKVPSPYVKSKGIAMIIDANTGKIVDNITAAEERVSKVAFNPDGTLLATGSWDGTAKIWDISTKSEISKMMHAGSIFDLKFDRNGTILATASGDYTGRIWDVETGTELSSMIHENPVYSISLSPDGSRVATASGDTACIWLWKPTDMISLAYSRLTRNLTRDEWQRYMGDEPYRDEIYSHS